MAYEEQIFTNLGQVQAPNPELSTGFNGGVANDFSITPETNQMLAQLTKDAIAKREKKVKDFETAWANKITTVNKYGDDIAPQDMKEINQYQDELIAELNTPRGRKALAGLDPQYLREIDQKTENIHRFSQESKNRKKTLEAYDEYFLKHPEDDNKANRLLYDKYKNSKLGESGSAIFTPVSNPLPEFAKDYSKWIDINGKTVITTTPLEGDEGRDITRTKKVTTFEQYLPYFKSYPNMETHLRREWETNPELQSNEATNTPEKYIEAKARENFIAEKENEKFTITINAEKQAAAKADALTKTLETREKIAEMSPAKRKEKFSEYEKAQAQADLIEITSIKPEFKAQGQALAKQYGLSGQLLDLNETLQQTPIYFALLDKKTVKKPSGDGDGTFYSPDATTIYKQIDDNGKAKYYFGTKDFVDTDNPMSEQILKSKAWSKDAIKQEDAFKNASDVSTGTVSGAKLNSANLLASAEKYKDVDYGLGAKGKNGKMDCSGLVCAILNDNGVKASGTSEEIVVNAPIKPNITKASDFMVGDVIGIDTGRTSFDKGRKNGIDHIGIVIEKNGKKYFTESRGSKGFDMTPLEEKLSQYQKNNYEMFIGRYDVDAPQKSDAIRNDGTNKGKGYFGELKMKDGSGKVATEIAIGIEIEGKETEVPTLVPTLTESEKDWLLKGNNPNDKSTTGLAITKKAVDHAYKRIKEGKSPFNDTPSTVKKGTYTSKSGIKFTVK